MVQSSLLSLETAAGKKKKSHFNVHLEADDHSLSNLRPADVHIYIFSPFPLKLLRDFSATLASKWRSNVHWDDGQLLWLDGSFHLCAHICTFVWFAKTCDAGEDKLKGNISLFFKPTTSRWATGTLIHISSRKRTKRSCKGEFVTWLKLIEADKLLMRHYWGLIVSPVQLHRWFFCIFVEGQNVLEVKWRRAEWLEKWRARVRSWNSRAAAECLYHCRPRRASSRFVGGKTHRVQ